MPDDRYGALRRSLRLAVGLAVVLAALGTVVATHGDDGTYDQPLDAGSFWNETKVSVIYPPLADDDIEQAARDSVDTWRRGIAAFGSQALVENVTLNVYVVGEDIPSVHAVADPDALYLTETTSGIAEGNGLPTLPNRSPTPDSQGLDPVRTVPTVDPEPECVVVGPPSPSLNYTVAYTIFAHELGHCLGLAHAGGHHPIEDLMAYDRPDEGLECPSNMNVLGLEQTFGPALDRPRDTSTVHVDVDAYEQWDCNEVYPRTEG